MLKFDREGLIPAVLQDARTRDVLMVAYMDEEAVRRTIETGDAWFWSRSRQELWHKGETSGNFQHVVHAQADCDADAILLEVNPEGPACHTGAISCFFQSLEEAVAAEPEAGGTVSPLPLGEGEGALAASPSGRGRFADGEPGEGARSGVAVLEDLAGVIALRHQEMPEGSYVAQLLQGGVDAIVRKVGEEATETIIAGKNDQKAELVWEVADLWFHTLVLLEARGASLTDVCAELARRRQ